MRFDVENGQQSKYLTRYLDIPVLQLIDCIEVSQGSEMVTVTNLS